MPSTPMETLVNPAARPPAGAFLQEGLEVDTHWHHHDMHQLQYAFDGSIEVEDALGRHLLPRQLAAWIPAGVVHRTSLHRVRSTSLLFAPSMVPEAGDRVRIVQVSPLMREMIMGATRWPLTTPHDPVGRAYFAALALLCGEWIRDEAPLSLPTSADPAVRAAMDHTRAWLRESDLRSASRAAGVSERTLRRRFRTQAGMSWEDYRRRARLLAAASLLTSTRQSIGAVAAEVGFDNQSAFAKAFRQMTGFSPAAFRRSS